MPVISIVTAVHNGGHQYLAEAYESLCEQDLPDGWTWQWVIQEDGTTGIPFDRLPDDPRISAGMGRHGRAAMARTMALERVNGVLTRALDADDLLAPGALQRDIETITAHPHIGWCVSACLDLAPDGQLVPGPYDPPPGPLPPGILAEGYRVGRLAVMGTTLCAYTELLEAVGGWQALPASEDVALLVVCEALSPGWMIGEVSEIYRKHPQQSTADLAYSDPREKASRLSILMSRVEALRRAGWQWTSTGARSGLYVKSEVIRGTSASTM